MGSRPAVFRVMKPIPEIGAQPGDYVLLRAGSPQPLLLMRELEHDHLEVLRDLTAFELMHPDAAALLPFWQHPPVERAPESWPRRLRLLRKP